MKRLKFAAVFISMFLFIIFLNLQISVYIGTEIEVRKLFVEMVLVLFLILCTSYSWKIESWRYTIGLLLITISLMADALNEFKWPFYSTSIENIMEDYILIIGLMFTFWGIHRAYADRQKVIREISQVAYFDHLTDLYNLSGFTNYMETFMSTHKQFVLISADFDNFKMINEVYGHEFGDRLLKQISKGLNNIITTDSIVSRVAADEFLLAVPLKKSQVCEKFVKNIIGNFDRVYTLDGVQVHVTVSVGVSMYPNHGSTVDMLINKANVALLHVKENGKNNYKLFDESLESQYEKELDLKIKLLRAFDHNELYAYYQPIVNVKTGEIECYEALCRWEIDGQFISPAEFIPVAEKYGIIQKIDYFMLEQVCRNLSRLNVSEDKYPKISINLSPISMVESELINHLEKIVSRYEIPFNCISFEITETAVINNMIDTVEKINGLYDLGFSIKLDDFGTGYSSLTHLKGLPIKTLKIDRSFIEHIHENNKDFDFIKGLIGFLHDINVEMVAEGVELKEQYDILKDCNCTMIQGYYFSKPYGFEIVEADIMKAE
jgi:diguanylate cyclase (GGDEF)-like protein